MENTEYEEEPEKEGFGELFKFTATGFAGGLSWAQYLILLAFKKRCRTMAGSHFIRRGRKYL